MHRWRPYPTASYQIPVTSAAHPTACPAATSFATRPPTPHVRPGTRCSSPAFAFKSHTFALSHQVHTAPDQPVKSRSGHEVIFLSIHIMLTVASAARGISGFLVRPMATRAELDRRAREGEVVVPGGAGGHSLEAQEHLAEGRHKGGETRAHQLGHEGFVEMGKKGGLASHGAEPYQAAVKHGVHIDEHKFMNESSIEEFDRRAREGEVVVPGGAGGHSLEAQKHLAEGRHKGGVTRAQQLGHEGYVEIGRKGGQA